jgi:hypothetical protein
MLKSISFRLAKTNSPRKDSGAPAYLPDIDDVHGRARLASYGAMDEAIVKGLTGRDR